MDVLRYRGRVVTDADVAFIRRLIAAHPSATRRALSHRLCEAWNWVQPNGVLRDMVCRGLLLALHRAGHIELPPARRSNPLGPQRRTPSRTTLRCNPIEGRLSDILPLDIAQVRRTVSFRGACMSRSERLGILSRRPIVVSRTADEIQKQRRGARPA